jgi:nitronate monooxygenase
MFPSTALTKLLGIDWPLIQAPMAGAATPAMISAVCDAGALGSLPAAYMSPAAMRGLASEVRARTTRPFNLNLFVAPRPAPDPAQIARALEWLRPMREALGMPAATVPEKFGEDFDQQFEALLDIRPAVASFTFGLLDARHVAALKQRDIAIVGTATTVDEARAWEATGAHAIAAQGAEAGAHRGTFLTSFEAGMVGTMALVPQVVDAVNIPVIAAGGIMDGRGIAAALMLGASGVQLGTAFLTCPESGISDAWKQALHKARDDQTLVSRVYSGRHARGIVNEFMQKLTPRQDDIPPFPIQNALTSPIRQTAGKANRPEFQSLFAGQAASMSRGLPAAELVATLMRETSAALRQAANISQP